MQLPIIIAIENVAIILDHINIFSPPGDIIILRIADASSFIELGNFPKIKLTVLHTKIPKTKKSIYLIWLLYRFIIICSSLKYKKILNHNIGCNIVVNVLNVNERLFLIFFMVNNVNALISIN